MSLGRLAVLRVADRLCVGGLGKSSGEKEIACVSVRNLNDLVLLSLTLDVLCEYQFHNVSPF